MEGSSTEQLLEQSLCPDKEQPFRKLATIREIDSIQIIPVEDKIEIAVIGGWRVAIKKGEYKSGDVAIYCEIDSWIPHSLAPFLTQPGFNPSDYLGVKGQRVKSQKIRGRVCQGRLLPLTVLPEQKIKKYKLGDNVTEILGIYKYDTPIPASLSGITKGRFPNFIKKTDQERIQNLSSQFTQWKKQNLTWEITEKLDGTSMTVYSSNGLFGVCSRKTELSVSPENTLWNVTRKNNLEEKLKKLGRNIALQGEVIGEGIQGNKYHIKGHEFYIFDIYNIDKQAYCNPAERIKLVKELELKHCPLVKIYNFQPEETIESLVLMGESKSLLNKNMEREGIVFKEFEERVSFKVISNKFLLKNEC